MNICGWEGLGMSTRWLGMLLGLPHLEMAGWGGIYSHQPKSSRWWSVPAKGAPDSPVRHHVILPLGLGAGRPLEALSYCGTRQSGGTPDSPVPLWLAALTSEFHSSLCRVNRCAQIAVAPLVHRTLSGGTPDGPVNYSGAAPGKPKGEEFELKHPGAPDTVRWHTGLSGAPDQGSLRFPFCSFLLRLNLFFWFVCVEPLAPVEYIIFEQTN
jgi:hypothetical protein